MTPTPTKEQIEAEIERARALHNSFFAGWVDQVPLIATALATARLEGEAVGRNKALDEAQDAIRQKAVVLMGIASSHYVDGLNNAAGLLSALKETGQ